MTARRDMEELRDLEDAIARTGEGEEGLGLSLMRESLERRKEQLLADAAGVLELALRGDEDAVSGGEIFLVSRVLKSLQESLASIAQVIAGAPTARGVIPGSIKDLVSLRILAAGPGSLQLKLVPAHPEQPADPPSPTLLDALEDPEPDADERPLIDRSMDRLLALLAYSEDEAADFLQEVADIGPRGTLHVKELGKALDEGGANASLSWQSGALTRSTTVSRAGAHRLVGALESVEEQTRQVTYVGRLVGGSLFRRTFELQPAGVPDTGVVAGEVAADAVPSLEQWFGKDCTAQVEIREASMPSGETKEAFRLLALGE